MQTNFSQMLKRTAITSLSALLFIALSFSQNQEILSPGLHGIGSWDHVDSLGNHRVIIKVNKQSDAVIADIPWRLREIGPKNKNVVVIDATNGEEINNIYPFEINREHGRFAFQPKTVPGEYFVYYLTYKKEGSYYPKVTYYSFEERADTEWVKKNKLTNRGRENKLENAEIIQFQSINALNSFYPMEIMATSTEVETLKAKNENEDYLLFTEDRKYPIRSNYDLPYKWIVENKQNQFHGIADRGEYYTFQVGVYALKKNIKNIKVRFGDIVNNETGTGLGAGSFTCFNTEGIDVTGNYFEKNYSVPIGELHPLWIGIQIPAGLDSGTYKGKLFINGDDINEKAVDLDITVTDKEVISFGDNDIWRHSRLRWLNSTIATDNEIVTPFTPLKLNRAQKSVNCLGRTIFIGDNGLPAQITSWFSERLTGFTQNGTDILESPIKFNIGTNGNTNWEVLNFEITKVTPGTIGWKTLCKIENFIFDCQAEIDFDGNINYEISLIATNDIELSDISLSIPLKKDIGKYMMGLGETGGYLTKDINWKWDVTRNQDGPWVGKENAGLQCRFRDTNYERPLNTNFYQKKPLVMPTSWYNEGKGGIDIEKENDKLTIKSYSGYRGIKKGERFNFNFNLAITPFKPIDTKKQWSHRFYHRHQSLDSIAEYGANTVNIHHATDINPYINYPFLTPGLMKEYVDEAHNREMKVKFYYTLRELSNSCPEIFALRSLGNEIFSEGEGGGYSWLQEHLDQTYIAAWFSPNKTDAAIINSGVSRWHNYYVEGLNWLVQNIGIDGIYIDDLAFDRITMKRMRKVLERGNPGTFLDLHSANQYNPRDGYANSANLYLEHLPYIDRLWFGEYFDYNRNPDFWMVEVSGIPYGVMGEMLQDGGNPWRGMLYGMTGRLPWKGAKVIKPIWDLWDDFGIEKSEMIGYWASDCPVKTGSKSTLATAYVQKGSKTMISVATWSEDGEKIKLDIDWDMLGLNPSNVNIHAPSIDHFQASQIWETSETIDVPAGKGFLIIIENKNTN